MGCFNLLRRRLLLLVGVVLLATAAPLAADKSLIAVLGDSLSAGYGLPENDGFVPQLQSALARLGKSATVVNAAISGDTSADGRRRVDWLLRKKPGIVIVELGANDMLRGLPTATLYNNLDAIITRIKASGARVLLAGMLATPTMGERYAADFAEVYKKLVQKHQVVFFPFFLKDVATIAELNLPDGIHPNRAGVKIIVSNIAPLVAQMLAP